jgi:hypothetical protein
MRPSRALLPLLSSLILCMVVWTSDVHALSITVSDGANTTTSTQLSFGTTQLAASTTGCLSGSYKCYGISGWGSAGKTIGSWLKITAPGNYTAGPVVSVLNTSSTSAQLYMNGAIFQGSNSGSGHLTITLTDSFSALSNASHPFTLIESGALLAPGGTNTVSTDTLQMTLIVAGTDIQSISTPGATGTISYPYNLSGPNTDRTTNGTITLGYRWLYSYNNNNVAPNLSTNTGSKFSDPPPCPDGSTQPCGPPPCPDGSTQPCNPTSIPGIGGGFGGSGTPDELDALRTLICGTCQEAVTIPEPSSLLLLGSGLLSGGIFFASRLRKEKEKETR